MKKLITMLVCTLSVYISYGQYPNRITLEGKPDIIYPIGTAKLFTTFPDTLSANKTPIKDYYGAIIYTENDKKVYFRSEIPRKWIELIPAGIGTVSRNPPTNNCKCCCHKH